VAGDKQRVQRGAFSLRQLSRVRLPAWVVAGILSGTVLPAGTRTASESSSPSRPMGAAGASLSPKASVIVAMTVSGSSDGAPRLGRCRS
jgi:hypothetical protein